ncbi:twitching motility protein PilT [Streptomyces sp. CNQ-509]|uniref:PIN domain-containing protein n=1 Tax=unclassified Streptomyces TaxID=2593676 RepID=UPI00062DE4A2|nr:PIN domain-containing protein [Streptomyces sp. CNQ-509]AKH82144.1 twitching motility protein PilT [Streptomyces sp. CNQ-509]
MTVTHLIDTSAAVRILTDSGVRQRWRDHLAQGVIAMCDITQLELLYSARSLADRLHMHEQIRTLFNGAPTPDATFGRAHAVQLRLTEKGTHRSAGAVDLALAAVAELSGLILLHYDRDFEAVADATDLKAVWVAAPGSL